MLNCRRSLSINMIRRLHEKLGISTEVLIRPSRDNDVAAITAIYAHHVLNGVASFEEVPPPAEEMARLPLDVLQRGR